MRRETGRTTKWSSRPSDSSERAAVTWPAATKPIRIASMRKHTPSTASAPVPLGSELGEHLFDGARDRGARRLRDEPVEERRQADGHPPADDRGPQQSGSPVRVGPKSSPRWASACARSGTMLAPTSRVPARCTATAASDRGEGDDRHEGQGLGRGERLELLHPAERGGPDQPVEAHAGVGDQPQRRS